MCGAGWIINYRKKREHRTLLFISVPSVNSVVFCVWWLHGVRTVRQDCVSIYMMLNPAQRRRIRWGLGSQPQRYEANVGRKC
jgi:hypothetical protein